MNIGDAKLGQGKVHPTRILPLAEDQGKAVGTGHFGFLFPPPPPKFLGFLHQIIKDLMLMKFSYNSYIFSHYFNGIMSSFHSLNKAVRLICPRINHFTFRVLGLLYSFLPTFVGLHRLPYSLSCYGRSSFFLPWS